MLACFGVGGTSGEDWPLPWERALGGRKKWVWHCRYALLRQWIGKGEKVGVTKCSWRRGKRGYLRDGWSLAKEDDFLDSFGKVWKETLLGRVERVKNGDAELSAKVSGALK